MVTALKLVREDGSPAHIEDLVGVGDTTIEIDGVTTVLVDYRGPDGLSARAHSSMTFTLKWVNRQTANYIDITGLREHEWCAFAAVRGARIVAAEAARRRMEDVQLVIGRPTAGFKKFGRRR